MPISKSYIGGTLIATDAAADVQIYIDAVQGVILAVLLQVTNGYITYASLERLEDISAFISYEVSFNISDLAYFGHDGDLQELFDDGHILGAYLADNIQIGNWQAFTGFSDEFPHKSWFHQFKAADSYHDLRPSMNDIFFNVEQAFNVEGFTFGILQDHEVQYALTVFRSSYLGTLPIDQIAKFIGYAAPPRIEAGISYHDGWSPNLSTIIDKSLAHTLPEFSSEMVHVSSSTTAQFVIKSSIENENTLRSENTSIIGILWSIKARVSEEDYPRWRNYIYSKYIGQNGRWLTWQPNNLEAPKEMPVYLSFLINRVPRPAYVKLYVQVTYQNNQILVIPGSQIPTPFDNTVFTLAMGYDQLGLSSAENPSHGPIVFYTVWLVDDMGYRISRKRRIYPIPSLPDFRYLVFANSLGGIDSLCVRYLEQTAEISSELFQRGLSDQYTTTSFEALSSAKKGIRTISLATTYLPYNWLTYLSELWHSTSVAILSGSRFVAVASPTTAFELPSDITQLSFAEFSLQFAQLGIGHSHLPLNVSTRPTAWVPELAYEVYDSATHLPKGYKHHAILRLCFTDTLPPEPVPLVATKPNTPGTLGYVSPFK